MRFWGWECWKDRIIIYVISISIYNIYLYIIYIYKSVYNINVCIYIPIYNPFRGVLLEEWAICIIIDAGSFSGLLVCIFLECFRIQIHKPWFKLGRAEGDVAIQMQLSQTVALQAGDFFWRRCRPRKGFLLTCDFPWLAVVLHGQWGSVRFSGKLCVSARVIRT